MKIFFYSFLRYERKLEKYSKDVKTLCLLHYLLFLQNCIICLFMVDMGMIYKYLMYIRKYTKISIENVNTFCLPTITLISDLSSSCTFSDGPEELTKRLTHKLMTLV